MKRAIGMGGIFFKAKDPQGLKEWYKNQLGINTLFQWNRVEDSAPFYTVWNVFPDKAPLFDDCTKDYVFNYCVDNLELLMTSLKDERVSIIDTREKDENGKFGFILDPEGNKIVLWEPSGKKVGPPASRLDRVTGLGGVFFKATDPQKAKAWYGKHLGLPVNDYGASLLWTDPNNSGSAAPALTSWSPFKSDTKYFAPSEKSFMLNYRVKNLVELLKALENRGVQIVGEPQEFSYGKFGWIMDPEDNKIELWEPKDDGF